MTVTNLPTCLVEQAEIDNPVTAEQIHAAYGRFGGLLETNGGHVPMSDAEALALICERARVGRKGKAEGGRIRQQLVELNESDRLDSMIRGDYEWV